jgi:hypothetical protein
VVLYHIKLYHIELRQRRESTQRHRDTETQRHRDTETQRHREETVPVPKKAGTMYNSLPVPELVPSIYKTFQSLLGFQIKIYERGSYLCTRI